MIEVSSQWHKAALAAGLCMLLLSGCGDGIEAPEAYVIGENNTVTLDSVLTSEDGGALVAVSEPTSEEDEPEEDEEQQDGEGEKEEKDEKKDKKSKKDKKKDKDEKKEEEKEEVEPLAEKTGEDAENADAEPDLGGVYVYTYSDINAATLDRFADALKAKEEGFCAINTGEIVDGGFTRLREKVDFEAPMGSVVFARNAVEKGILFEVLVNWSGKACIVTVQCTPGSIYIPVEEPAEEKAAAPAAQRAMTLTEAVEYVRTLPPSALGLEGESMDDYVLLPGQGTPLVDGEPCRRLNVYEKDTGAGTNVVKGIYLVGAGEVYLVDEDTKEARVVHSW